MNEPDRSGDTDGARCAARVIAALPPLEVATSEPVHVSLHSYGLKHTNIEGDIYMAVDQGPVVQGAVLRNSLTRLRKDNHLTQEQVAEDLEWSPSKLIRVEGGRSGITKTDLDALLTRYGLTAENERQELQDLNRASREPAWWDAYRGEITTPYLSFVGYEAGAAFIRQFITNIVPGLLQTESYAKVLTENTVTDPMDVRPVVNLRLQRQKELAQRSTQPYQYYVLDEAVIRRHIGIKVDPAIMPNQLNSLADRAERDDRVTVRVIPFSEGAHPGVNVAGAFTLLEFDSGLPDLLYRDEGRGDVAAITGDDPEVSTYQDLFESLVELAMSGTDSIAFMRKAAEDLSLSSLASTDAALHSEFTSSTTAPSVSPVVAVDDRFLSCLGIGVRS
jgi:transcriptional regulator with XRE-family HTH domain